MQRWILALLLSTLFLAGVARAQDPYIPPALEDWREWVLHGQEWRDCPVVFDGRSNDRGSRVCGWPGVLELDVTDAGAEFRQMWTIDGDLPGVPLPGSKATNWPESVEVNGRPALVLSRNETPYVELPPGTYTITGEFRWDSRPGELEISARIGVIDLTIDGERVLVPDVDEDLLFLGERRTTELARDEIRTDVYRLAIDGSPSRLTTVLRINVSGGLREASFGPFLPEGFVPERLDSRLPARFEPNGQLRVQVRPGEWIIRLTARAGNVLNEFAPVVGGANMPDVEILSYQSDPRLRVTVPSGLVPVDPGQANVPPEWRSFPAYRVGAGDALSLEERSRGLVDSQNELAIGRRLWLDFDGDGMTALDNITGTMRRDWRLDMRAPFTLESAKVNGEDVLVTAGAAEDLRGIEIRQQQLMLSSIARIDTNGRLPVTGWDTRFTGASIELNLPPGRRLVAAPGADAASGAWFGRWQLLDIFLLLVVTAASWRLFGALGGGVAFSALALSFHEFGAPVWLWLNLLATVALLRVAPVGRLKTWLRTYFYLGLAALAFVLVPFVADQFKYALYPQLELATMSRVYSDMDVQPTDANRFSMPREAAMKSVADMADEEPQVLEEVIMQGSALAVSAPPPRRFQRYAPNALVQAGPGVPGWQWQRYVLRWDGPVEAGQSVRLVIAPPWALSAWRIAAALLTAVFAVWFIAEALRRQWTLPGGLRIGATPAVLVMALFFAAAPGTGHANELPDAQLLEQLRQRLIEPPDCEPRCAEFVAARVAIDPRSLRIDLDVHASVPVAMPVPGFDGDWRPQRVTLDGEPVVGINRDEEALLVFVPPGQRRVTLVGALPDKASIQVPFPETPRVIDVQARGWSAAGVVDRRLVTGSLQFDRVREASEAGAAPMAWEASRFPTFVSVTRRLELGLEWRVVTTVERVAPEAGALEVGIPLIEGESVTTEGIDIENGQARVAMAPDERRVVWTSSLDASAETRLTAGDGARWVDTWEVAAGSIWHVEFDGLPESVDRQDVPGARVARFHPRPGETLTITASRPEAVAGATTAIDTVRLEASVGRRLVDSSLEFTYRATRGDQQAITLPPGAELTAVTIDRVAEPLMLVDGVLTIPIRPGMHAVSIRFREAKEHGFIARAPRAALGLPASNVHVALDVSSDRWLLLTNGPTLGPAVLYWPQLLVLIGLALVLGRIPWTPLKARHWLLLSLGFSMFNWPVLALVAAWLLMTGSRGRWPVDQSGRLRYNALQVFHAAFTVIALASIIVSLPIGLLGSPDMHVVGNGSWSTGLRWFADQVDGAMPDAMFVSLPLWAYKALILAWALWLTFALLAWLPWAWRIFASAGLWRGKIDA